MKKLTLILAILLCVALCFGLVACDPPQDEYPINYDIDLSQKPTLSVLMPYSGYDKEKVNSDPTALLIEQLSGYKVEYTQLPAVDSSITINTELMDRRPYNLMKLTKDQFSDLVMDDMLVDITDALQQFAPDVLANILEESWEVVTVDGRIYGIPERASSDNIENPIVFNQDLLFQCNLDVPQTLDQFTEVLEVLTEKLGRPALTFDRYTPLVYAISSAFGIYSEWQEYTVNGKTQVLYYMNAPGYADYVNYMHDLYSRGWIDQQVATNSASDAVTCFVNGFKSDSTTSKAAAVACSLWSVPSIVTSMQSNGVINGTEASGTLDNYLVYLRALKNQNGEEKVYRASGYAYISAIPFYMAENAGYVLDWVNSKIKDTEEAHNFRSIVLGEEGTHWTYSPSQGYLPSENFSEKDDASYYLTGSNETVYTQYWLARVRKQAELYRAWSTLMQNADAVGVYNIVDFTPPLEDYNSNRSYMEEYAQDQFFIMLKEGTDNMQEYLTKLNSQQGGDKATKAINDWYSSYNR